MKTRLNETVQVGTRPADALRPRPTRLAHPVRVGEQRHRSADAADQRQRVRRLERLLRAEVRPVGAGPQHDQHDRPDDRRELQPDEPLDHRQEPLVSAEPHQRECRDGVQQTPDRHRHRRKDRCGHERARRDQRARDEVAPDDEVDEERQDHCARQVIAPGLDECVAGAELPARGALGDRELEDHAGGQRPHQREPIFSAGDGGGHHVADTDACRCEQEAWAYVGELHVGWWLVVGGWWLITNHSPRTTNGYAVPPLNISGLIGSL